MVYSSKNNQDYKQYLVFLLLNAVFCILSLSSNKKLYLRTNFHNMRKLLYLFSILLFTSTIFAQTGNIRGFIYEKSSGEPIMFCSVFLKGTTIGAATDINGMYNISRVKTVTTP